MKPVSLSKNLLFALLLALLAGCEDAQQQAPEVAQLPVEQQATVVSPSTGILNGGKTENVSDSSVNTVPPEDALREINFGAAGGGVDCSKSQAEYAHPEFDTSVLPETIQLMEAPLLLSCGWSDKEQILVTVRYPDGREITHQGQAEIENGVSSLSINYQVSIDDPPGTYTVIEEGSSGRIETSFNAIRPTGPLLVFVLDDRFNADPLIMRIESPTRLLLYGFSANEVVRLFMYKDGSHTDASLIGSQQVTTGPDGNLVVANQVSGANFWVAVGERSGTVAQKKYSMTGMITSDLVVTAQCPLVKPSRVDVGMTVWAVDTSSANLRICENVGCSQGFVKPLSKEIAMDISYNPECAGGTWWWYVQAGDTLGWVAEADPNEYLIEPAP